MRIKKREIVGKAKTNGIFLIPIFIFIFLFANVNFVSASFPANNLGIFYNFSYPNGFNGTQLVFNGGSGASGFLAYLNGTGVNPLNQTISLNEVVPYGLGNKLVNAWESNRTGTETYIDTNEFGGVAGVGLNLTSSFSYSQWIKSNFSMPLGTGNTNENETIFNLTNGYNSHDMNIRFGLYETRTFSTPNDIFDKRIYFYIENRGFSTLTCLSNILQTVTTNEGSGTAPQFFNQFQQIGFIYNGSALAGGNLVQLFYNGSTAGNCTAGALSGSVNQNTTNHILIQPQVVDFMTDIAYWNYDVGMQSMRDAYNGTYSFVQPQPPILLQGTPFPDAPYFINTGSKTLDLNNYFAGYTTVNIHVPYALLNGTTRSFDINKSISDTNITTNTDAGIIVQAQGTGSSIALTMTANNRSYSGQFTLTAQNNQGNVVGTFALYSNVVSGSGVNGTGVSSGDFFGIYPDSSTLTLGARVEYIVITFFAIALLFIGGLGVLFSENKRNVGDGASLGSYLTILFCLIFFIYFVTIGYITIGMLIVITLIALILCYILFVHRGRTGGT